MFLVTGVQGSGKTYYGVKLLLELRKKQKFQNHQIVTNIDSFKLPHINIEAFFLELETAYQHYLNNQNSINPTTLEKIDRYLKLNYIVLLDEAHNYMNKATPLMIWFVTEHRHMNVELIVLTQKEILINTNLRIYDRIIEAMPPSSTFSSSFLRYNEYSGTISPHTKISSWNEKKDKTIFDIYTSGDILETNRPYIKWLIFLLVLIVIMIFAFKWFMDSFFHTSKEDTNITNIDSNISKNSFNSKKDDINGDEVFVTILFDKGSGKYEYNSFIFDSYVYKKFQFHVISETCYDNICSSSCIVSSKFLTLFLSQDKEGQFSQKDLSNKGVYDVNKTI